MREAGRGAGGSSQCSCTRQTALLSPSVSRGHQDGITGLTSRPHQSDQSPHSQSYHALSAHCLVRGPVRHHHLGLLTLLDNQCTAELSTFTYFPAFKCRNRRWRRSVQFTKYSANILQTHIQTSLAGSTAKTSISNDKLLKSRQFISDTICGSQLIINSERNINTNCDCVDCRVLIVISPSAVQCLLLSVPVSLPSD